MWSVVTWLVRSRPVRRMLVMWLGLLIRRRLRATGAGLWSDTEDSGDGRSRWPWLLALAVGGLAAGLLYRRSTRGRRTNDHRPPPSTPPIAATPASRPTSGEATRVPTPAAAGPARSVADLSGAPDEPDLAAGEAVIGRSLAIDDLKVVEGIGPKIEQLLNDNGVHTWHDLSVADVNRLRDILQEAGARYRMHDPSSWPQQATLLVRGDWEAFSQDDRVPDA